MEFRMESGNGKILDVTVVEGVYAFSDNKQEQYYRDYKDMPQQEKDSFKQIQSIMERAFSEVQKVVMTLPQEVCV